MTQAGQAQLTYFYEIPLNSAPGAGGLYKRNYFFYPVFEQMSPNIQSSRTPRPVQAAVRMQLVLTKDRWMEGPNFLLSRVR